MATSAGKNASRACSQQALSNNRVKADRAKSDRVVHGVGHDLFRGSFHQTQNLDELALAP